MTHICLIEDDPIMGEALTERLHLEGFGVDWQRTGRAGLQALTRQRADLAIIDVNLPDFSGAELFERLLGRDGARPPTLFITGYGTIEDAVRLLKLGAADYLTKPLDPVALIERLHALAGTARERRELAAADPPLGVSPAMRRIAADLERFARHPDTPVLIGGESGVGKEVVARRLHRLQCPNAPFVAVNCAALPESLLETELFGHEQGAFTGAERRRAGVFEQAGSGVLFLDEIGDMPLPFQACLLRVVQSRQLTRIGGSRTLEVPARVVCATHRDLARLVAAGRFREDLYYRLRVLELRIPPLRERPEDIAWLAERCVAEHGRRFPDERRQLTEPDRQWLLGQHWPGNARELQHTLERACILGEGDRLALSADTDADDAPPPLSDPGSGVGFGAALKSQAQASERAAILAALAAQDWRVLETARRLGISRKTLWQKMKKYGIERME